MLEKGFLDYIRSEKLFGESENILLTISGGLDSMAMLDLFIQVKINIGIAHCNFNLRRDESDEDANFVRSVAHRYEVPYFEKSFETTKFANEHKLSVQEAARELRYHWFEEITAQENYKYYATAHHFDDQLETFFINLFRGTGVKGLRGIPPKNGNCIRPLLFTTRNEIKEYATKQNVPFREDSSNFSEKYLRNRIRQQILPALVSVKPDFKTGFRKTFQLLKGTEEFIDVEISKLRKHLVRHEEDQVRIAIGKLKILPHIQFYLYELLKPFGINEEVINKIPKVLAKTPGKLFISKTHQLLINREDIIISPINAGKPESYLIEAGQTEMFYPVEFIFERSPNEENTVISHDPNVAQLDFDILEFPLKLRKWQEGDYFYPFGMKGRKKVSDYFIDQKFSLFDKQKTWLLVSGNQIVWIAGHRIDNRYKIDQQTNIIYRTTMK